ncbi:MAG TPA: His/Gly/Thr/Pro-type tRNA ligase C-terminal domain-containing protein, partial [SAR86 cluster bacterium]|nr:His/Gly/Thr/Pro-type tRNA ligase C-terminal domain-containing protein [SAR86 cluster bacterium]
LPVWLSPIQAQILNITDKQGKYSEKIRNLLQKSGFRAQSDLRKEKITYKIRDHSMQKTPFLLVIGDKEVENETVSVRARGGEDLGEMSVNEFMDLLQKKIDAKN